MAQGEPSPDATSHRDPPFTAKRQYLDDGEFLIGTVLAKLWLPNQAITWPLQPRSISGDMLGDTKAVFGDGPRAVN